MKDPLDHISRTDVGKENPITLMWLQKLVNCMLPDVFKPAEPPRHIMDKGEGTDMSEDVTVDIIQLMEMTQQLSHRRE